MKKITKSYVELLHKASKANGRKEVVSLLKKAAKLKSKIEEKSVA
tara:strand:- start:258 stop:392 length:135 start_codon:yes stop_codon:yes gene_type:complete